MQQATTDTQLRLLSIHRQLTILDVLLPVEEPIGDLVLARVLHDGHNLVDLLLGQLSGATVKVNVGLKGRIKFSHA